MICSRCGEKLLKEEELHNGCCNDRYFLCDECLFRWKNIVFKKVFGTNSGADAVFQLGQEKYHEKWLIGFKEFLMENWCIA